MNGKWGRIRIRRRLYKRPVEIRHVSWNAMAVKLMQEIGRRITNVTEDTRETTFLFQRLSMALQQGECGRLPNTMLTE